VPTISSSWQVSFKAKFKFLFLRDWNMLRFESSLQINELD
jgi:hypothetical protein